jgi:hypothetical protein
MLKDLSIRPPELYQQSPGHRGHSQSRIPIILNLTIGSMLHAGGKRARMRDAAGKLTGQTFLYSIVGALDPTYALPDDRLLCVPTSDKDKELAFPSPAAAGWGNATFLALCMKLAYEVRRLATSNSVLSVYAFCCLHCHGHISLGTCMCNTATRLPMTRSNGTQTHTLHTEQGMLASTP